MRATGEIGQERLIVRAGARPVPGELVRRLRQAKLEVLAVRASPRPAPADIDRGDEIDPAWWRALERFARERLMIIDAEPPATE